MTDHERTVGVYGDVFGDAHPLTRKMVTAVVALYEAWSAARRRLPNPVEKARARSADRALFWTPLTCGLGSLLQEEALLQQIEEDHRRAQDHQGVGYGP